MYVEMRISTQSKVTLRNFVARIGVISVSVAALEPISGQSPIASPYPWNLLQSPPFSIMSCNPPQGPLAAVFIMLLPLRTDDSSLSTELHSNS